MVDYVDDSGFVEIIYFLTDKDLGVGKIKGDIITPNFKSQYKNMKKSSVSFFTATR